MFYVLAQIEEFPTSPPILCSEDFWGCFNFLFLLVLKSGVTLAFALSVIMIGWAGFLYMTKPEKSQEIHKRLLWGIIGFIVAILSFAIVKFLERLITPTSKSSFFYPLFLNLNLINFVFAQEEPPSELNCGGIKIPSILETTSPVLEENGWFICTVYIAKVLLTLIYRLLFVLATIYLLWTGIQYVTKPEKSSELHKNFLYIAIGIIIGIFSFTIVQLINLFFRTAF